MTEKIRTISIWYKIVLIACGGAGLLLTCGIFDGEFRPEMLFYFTNLSNLLVLVYFIGDVVFLIRAPKGSTDVTWCPVFKGMVTMAILLTGGVAAILLQGMFRDGTGTFLISLIFLHDIVPVMTAADYFLFDRKGRIRRTDPLLWTIPPLAYLAFVLAAVSSGQSLGSRSGSQVPYPFLDAGTFGVMGVIFNIAMISAAYIAAGYLFYFFDRKMGERTAGRKMSGK